jgi:hypothetical protein
MKRKILAILTLLTVAVALGAQTGGSPATQDHGKAKTSPCACCNHEKPAGEMEGTCSDCCKAGKCPMMSGATGAKCPMMEQAAKSTKANSGCCGDKCPMHGKGKGHGCCCGDMA